MPNPALEPTYLVKINPTGKSQVKQPAGKGDALQLHDVPVDRVVISDPASSAGAEPSGEMPVTQAPAAAAGKTADDQLLLSKNITIAGRYKLVSKLGEGGMGFVFLADDNISGGQVAVKISNNSSRKVAGHQFQLEYNGLRSVEGLSQVSQMIDFGQHNGLKFIVTKFIKAQSLGDLMRASPTGHLSVPEVMEIVGSACYGLEGMAERGLSHRDIKPDNLMVPRAGGRPQTTLIDLGIATPFETSVHPEGDIYGTPRYISPEGAINLKLDARADLYSLGATAYKAMTGSYPFDIQGRFPLHADLTPAQLEVFPWQVQDIMQRTLAVSRQERFGSAGELMAATEAYIQAEEGNFQSFSKALADGVKSAQKSGAPTAGTLIYIAARDLTTGLEDRINLQFSRDHVFRSDRQGMEGLFVYSRRDEQAVLAKNEVKLAALAEEFGATVVVRKVAAAGTEPAGRLFDAASELVTAGKRPTGYAHSVYRLDATGERTQLDEPARENTKPTENERTEEPTLAGGKPSVKKTPASQARQQSTVVQSALERARDQALARINRLPASSAEKAQMRKVAAASWDAELERVETNLKAKKTFEAELKQDYDRARALQKEIDLGQMERSVLRQKNAELAALKNQIRAKVNGFVRQQGPMMAVIIALDIAMNYNEIKKAGVAGTVKREAVAAGGVFAFVVGQKALEATLGAAVEMNPARLGGALAAGMAIVSSVAEHQEHLASSDAATKAYAQLAIGVQGLTAYISASAGLAAAKAAAPAGPWAAAAAGVGAGTLTYVFMSTAGKALGTDKWIARKWTRGDIINAFHDLGARRDGAGVLAVKDQNTEIPYFNEVARRVEVNGQTVNLTRAQEFLGVLMAARNYDKLSFEQRQAIADQPGNRPLAKLLGGLGSLDRLEIGSYDQLDEEMLAAVSDAIARYRVKHHVPDDTSGSRSRFEVVCSNYRRVPVTNPLTGEVVGSRTYVDIKVFGERQHFAMLATGNGWVSDGENTVNSYAISGPIKTEGDGPKIEAAEAIRATASRSAPGTYDISLQELAALDLSLPAEKLAQLPVVRRDLTRQLALLGYKADDLVKAYTKYAMHGLDLTQVNPGVSLDVSGRQASADPFQVYIQSSVLKQLQSRLLTR